jgi:hypothetical protein
VAVDLLAGTSPSGVRELCLLTFARDIRPYARPELRSSGPLYAQERQMNVGVRSATFMKSADSSPRTLVGTPQPSLTPDDLRQLTEQLQEAYPTATEKLLVQAIEACRKEAQNPDDRERLIRCVVERITT